MNTDQKHKKTGYLFYDTPINRSFVIRGRIISLAILFAGLFLIYTLVLERKEILFLLPSLGLTIMGIGLLIASTLGFHLFKDNPIMVAANRGWILTGMLIAAIGYEAFVSFIAILSKGDILLLIISLIFMLLPILIYFKFYK